MNYVTVLTSRVRSPATGVFFYGKVNLAGILLVNNTIKVLRLFYICFYNSIFIYTKIGLMTTLSNHSKTNEKKIGTYYSSFSKRYCHHFIIITKLLIAKIFYQTAV
uniref:Uncharacterized protein n=1 Tax=Cacopsylla melanoneura TaxID=428564 RepID=A0A8D8PP12_9HEMI